MMCYVHIYKLFLLHRHQSSHNQIPLENIGYRDRVYYDDDDDDAYNNLTDFNPNIEDHTDANPVNAPEPVMDTSFNGENNSVCTS